MSREVLVRAYKLMEREAEALYQRCTAKGEWLAGASLCKTQHAELIECAQELRALSDAATYGPREG